MSSPASRANQRGFSRRSASVQQSPFNVVDRRAALFRACYAVELLEQRWLLSISTVDPTVNQETKSISLTPGAQTYIYGQVVGGEFSSDSLANGSAETVNNSAGMLAADLAVSTQPSNSFTTNCDYYAISGVGVSGYTNMQALYGQYVDPNSGFTSSGSTEASVKFTLTQPALVVAMGLGSSQQSLSFQGPSGLVTDYASSSATLAAGIAHVSLSAGTYTIQETATVTAADQTQQYMADLLGVYIFTGSTSAVVPSAAITTPSGTQTGAIAINYSLADANSDTCNVSAEYSTDGGTTWYTATQGSGGNGMYGLTSSPTGTDHTFVWYSPADIGDVSLGDVEFQITPSSATETGTPVSTGPFAIDNTSYSPPTWLYTTFGATANLGTFNSDGTTWNLSGSSGNIQAGQFDFGSQSVTIQPSGILTNGGYTLSAFVSSPSGSSSSTAGIVVTSGLSSNSPFVSLYVTNGGLIAYSYVQTTGGPIISGSASASGIAPAEPIKLFIVVRDESVSLYYQANGDLLPTRIKFPDTGLNTLALSWLTVHSTTQAGMFVSSGVPAVSSTAYLTNVTIDTSATNGSGVGTAAALNVAFQDLAAIPQDVSTAVGDVAAAAVQGTESAITNALSSLNLSPTTLIGGLTSELADAIEGLSYDNQTISQMIENAEAGDSEPILTTGIGVTGTCQIPLLPPGFTIPIPAPVPVEAEFTLTVEDNVSVELPKGGTPELQIEGDYSVKFNAGIGVQLSPSIPGVPSWDLSVQGTPLQLTTSAVDPLADAVSLSFSVGAEAEIDLGPISGDWQYTLATWDPFTGDLQFAPPQGFGTVTTSYNISDSDTVGFLLSLFGQEQLGGTIDIPLGGTTQLAITTPAVSGTAGQKLPTVTVTLENTLGQVNTTDGSDVTLLVNPDPTLYGTTTVAAINGVATFSNLYLNTSNQFSFEATDASDGINGTLPSGPIAIAPATASQLVFVAQPASTTAGATISPVIVAVEDKYGNVVSSDSSYVTLGIGSSRGGSVGPDSVDVFGPNNMCGSVGAMFNRAVTARAQNGEATFSNLSEDRAGTYTFQATDRWLTPAISNSFTISPGTATRMAFLETPSRASYGKAFSVQVELLDQYGNLATNDTSDVTLSVGTHPRNAVLHGLLTEPVMNGVATFNGLWLNAAGFYNLLAVDNSDILSVISPFFYAA